MSPTTLPPTTEPTGLSCYTANLAGYLAGEFGDVVAHLARSVRLAVRVDAREPAYSHHRYPLNLLPGGDHLRYTGAPTTAEALRGLRAELDRHGRALAVANTRALPWSPSYRKAEAPHWLLLDDHRPGSWHVVDRFAALLPEGEQRPHTGWLDDDELAAALTPSHAPTREQLTRDRYAFGFPAAMPPATYVQWLVRVEGPAPSAALAGQWLTGVPALEYLAGWFADQGAGASGHLDDVWAAAQHHLYRLAWLATRGPHAAAAITPAQDAWRQLPRALRFAVDSARRGRPRASLIKQSFHAVAAHRPEPDL